MTGMPASLAFWIAGRMALVSCASTIRTLAPFEIMVSMSVACCSLLRFASASMYVPPPASTVFLMFGLSCAAQRGCWKLFHDTPTVQAPRRRPARRTALALAAAAALGAVVAPCSSTRRRRSRRLRPDRRELLRSCLVPFLLVGTDLDYGPRVPR